MGTALSSTAAPLSTSPQAVDTGCHQSLLALSGLSSYAVLLR